MQKCAFTLLISCLRPSQGTTSDRNNRLLARGHFGRVNSYAESRFQRYRGTSCPSVCRKLVCNRWWRAKGKRDSTQHFALSRAFMDISFAENFQRALLITDSFFVLDRHREQRVTGIVVFTLCGISVFMVTVLRVGKLVLTAACCRTFLHTLDEICCRILGIH